MPTFHDKYGNSWDCYPTNDTWGNYIMRLLVGNASPSDFKISAERFKEIQTLLLNDPSRSRDTICKLTDVIYGPMAPEPIPKPIPSEPEPELYTHEDYDK